MRQFHVIVAGERLSLTQAARAAAPPPPSSPQPAPPPPAPSPSPCTFALSPPERSFDAAGGNGAVRVTTGANCAWTAASSASWLAITGSSTGTGSADVGYTVAPNLLTSRRDATVTIGGSVHRVSQSGVTGGGVAAAGERRSSWKDPSRT